MMMEANICFGVIRMLRFEDPDNSLFTVFAVLSGSSQTAVVLADEMVFLTRFDIDPFKDIGGTLKISATLTIYSEVRPQILFLLLILLLFKSTCARKMS